MDCVSPILDVATRLWDCTAKRAVYIRHLPRNLNSLSSAMEELKNVSPSSPEEMPRNLLPRDCLTRYKLGKMVPEKMDAVAALRSKADQFHEVAVPLPSPPVIQRPLDKTVGQDLLFGMVWKWLQDDGEQVSSIGLYGMGGVGKTTLLNRNNNELHKNRVEFDAVIWVTVSRPANVEKVQQVLFNKLEIPKDKWDGRSEDERAEEIFNVLKTKKFVLLLDDIWEWLDLSKVGIPPLNHQDKLKMVLTTRSKNVCQDMEVTESIEVNCLPWEDAFALFQTKVGADTINSHPDIPKLAEMVAKECGGLPLALITIGRAMAGTKTPEEWEKKIQMLKNYPAKFPGMENRLFSRLAFSYDSLPDEAIKSCFLYCSLFPEDYEISHRNLIQLWIGEGFLDGYDNLQEARNQGEEVIKSLQLACLLENGRSRLDKKDEYSKMHDVIRDMALWLARENGKKKNKFVVKDGVESIRAQEVEKWKETQRISLWNTNIEELREPPYFPNMETFLAPRKFIRSFPNRFFTNMPIIRVLDLSNNFALRELPVEIGNLVTLQYLNLSDTKIKYLPVELKNLKKLRCLILNDMYFLKSLPSQMVSSLSSLQLFSMYSMEEQVFTGDDERRLLEELEQLEHVDDIYIHLTSVSSIQTLFNSHKLQRSTRCLLLFCERMNLVQLSLYIETLYIIDCVELQDVKINFEKEVVVYSKFPRHQCLNNLCDVKIDGCGKLLNLTWLICAPSLQFLSVKFCESMEKVIDDERSEVLEIEVDHLGVFSRLKSLTLLCLPKLRSIHGRALSFPSLRYIRVFACPSLRKLPFDSNTGVGKKLEKIKGEQEWWDELKWEDQTIMHNLTPYFQPIEHPWDSSH
ncbi:Disease resistance protein RPS5 [Vitis vinifera]|uniref:Disease resistance protein RPS5 n=1 Tax=Vitis vinifera TaxID=29760 RepID=A0A438CN86_VITVI|nr:Disease resistance protein RPS5 [Vitis vinifera]